MTRAAKKCWTYCRQWPEQPERFFALRCLLPRSCSWPCPPTWSCSSWWCWWWWWWSWPPQWWREGGDRGWVYPNLACKMRRWPVLEMMKLESPLVVSMGTPFLNQAVTVGRGRPIGGWHLNSAWLPSLICVEYGGVSKSFRRSGQRYIIENGLWWENEKKKGSKQMERMD